MWLFLKEMRKQVKSLFGHFVSYALCLIVFTEGLQLLERSGKVPIISQCERWINSFYEPAKRLFGVCGEISLQNAIHLIALICVPLMFAMASYAFCTMAETVKEEERMGTVVYFFSLSGQTRRSTLLLQKFAAKLTGIAVLNAAMWAVSTILTIIDPLNKGNGISMMGQCFALWIGMFSFQVCALCAGLFYGAWKTKNTAPSEAFFNITAVSAGVGILYNFAQLLAAIELKETMEENFVVQFLQWIRNSSVLDQIHKISMLSPIRWCFPADIVENGVNYVGCAAFLVVSIFLAVGALLVYHKKDLA